MESVQELGKAGGVGVYAKSSRRDDAAPVDEPGVTRRVSGTPATHYLTRAQISDRCFELFGEARGKSEPQPSCGITRRVAFAPEKKELQAIHRHRGFVQRLETHKANAVRRLHGQNADLEKQVREMEKATAEVDLVAHTHGSPDEVRTAVQRLTATSRTFGTSMAAMLNGMDRMNAINLAMGRGALPPDHDDDGDDGLFDRAAAELVEDRHDGKFMFEWTESSVTAGLDVLGTALHSAHDSFSPSGHEPHGEQPDGCDSVAFTPELIAMEEMEQQHQSLQDSLTLACGEDTFSG